MPLSMYQAAAPIFTRGLDSLALVLGKAADHAAARGFDPAVLVQARLAPDMFPLVRQVQIASDFAKGAMARLAGAEVPAWDDVETTLEALKARAERACDYVKGFTPAQIDGSEDRDITLVRRGETSVVKGQAYLIEQALPNFFFHRTTAYTILRHNGVALSKGDFLGGA